MKRLAAALALSVIAVLASAGPASAHSYLVDSTPEAGGVLNELPDFFSVTANEPLLDLAGNGSGFGLEIIGDDDGLYYGDGCVSVDGATLSTPAVLGEPGRYLVVYQFVSADGHAVSDTFSFDWAPAGEYVVSSGSSTAGDCNGLYARGDDATDTAEAASTDLDWLLWIGGALLAVVIAVVVTLVVLRRVR